MSRRGAMWLAGAVMVLSACGSKHEANTEAATAPPVNAPVQRRNGRITLPADSPQRQRIHTAAVESAEVPRQELVAPGRIEMNPNRVSKIVMPVAGRVRQVLVQTGDAVHKGQPLITIDSPDVGTAMSAYRQAEANTAQARAAVAKAEADVSRARDLLANRALAQKEVLSAETILAQAKAQVEQAQAGAEDARHRLSVLGLKPGSFEQQVVVLATLPGKVMDLSIVPGEYRTDTNAPILTIADLGVVWVAADVPESAIRYTRPGEHVSIRIGAYPDETFTGTVKRIADTVDPQSRTIKVRAELNNSGGRFRPEMFAEIRQSQGVQRLPVVPSGAVLQGEGRNTVYVERAAGEFEEIPVTVAWQQGGRTALSAGVREGDRVVTEGAMLLRGAQ